MIESSNWNWTFDSNWLWRSSIDFEPSPMLSSSRSESLFTQASLVYLLVLRHWILYLFLYESNSLSWSIVSIRMRLKSDSIQIESSSYSILSFTFSPFPLNSHLFSIGFNTFEIEGFQRSRSLCNRDDGLDEICSTDSIQSRPFADSLIDQLDRIRMVWLSSNRIASIPIEFL